MLEWLAMGGHGFFIWSSYGMLLAALIVEVIWLRHSRKQAMHRAAELRNAGGQRRQTGVSAPPTV